MTDFSYDCADALDNKSARESSKWTARRTLFFCVLTCGTFWFGASAAVAQLLG